MTFNAFQQSVSAGAPVWLYEFSIGTTTWRYTGNDEDYIYNNLVWEAPAGGISRSNITGTQDVRKQGIKITAARTLPFYQQTWGAGIAPTTDVLVRVIVVHATDPDQQGQVEWIGRIATPSRMKSTISLACDPYYTGVQTQGLRRCFQINCPHVLYGRQCTLNAETFAVPATIDTMADATAITSSDLVLADGFSFNGGFISWDSPFGYTEKRSIVAWDPDSQTITIAYGGPDIVPGLHIKAFPGCDHTLINCATFGNNLNYGGQPAIPNDNPMDGSTPIF